MDEPAELQHNEHWRMAVWSLRVGFVGLAVGVAGIIVLSTGSTPWLLAVGVIVWLVAAAVTLTGVFGPAARLPRAEAQGSGPMPAHAPWANRRTPARRRSDYPGVVLGSGAGRPVSALNATR